MPFIERSKFEKHVEGKHHDDDLHVHAISNPEEAAHIAALKLVMNTHLREKLELLDTEKKQRSEYLKTIINQKNQSLVHDIIKTHVNALHAEAHIHHGVLGRSH